MFEIRTLIRFFDTGFILKFLILVMLISILPIIEVYLYILLSCRISTYLMIAALTGSSLAGLIISYGLIKSRLKIIKLAINEGEYPENDFYILAGIFIASILLITPGFIGDLIGLIILLPGISKKVGFMITRPMEDKVKELYEYIKLYELN
ncbi:MAG: FxsA family protein [Spirochaetales bacterium]|nr:FxsA family protein [Spirochaetales bacterium]